MKDRGKTIDRVRKICRALPVCEVEGDQHHKISVRGKTVGWHTVDWGEVGELITDAYRLAAPKTLAQLVD